MRLSTNNVFEAGVSNLLDRQRNLQESQLRLTSGKRIERSSDDPIGAARAERALANIHRLEANQRTLEASRNNMQLSEGTLGDAVNLMQQVRETLLALSNGAYGDGDRSVLTDRLAQLRTSLLDVANRPDGAGGYLFAGQGATQPPFLDTMAGVVFKGTMGAIRGSQSDHMPLSVDGAAAWLLAPTGNGVFETQVLSSTTAWIGPGTVVDPSQLALTPGTVYTVQFTGPATTSTYEVFKDGAPTGVSGFYKEGQSIEVDGMAFAVLGAPADGDQFQIVPATNSLSIFDTLDRIIADMRVPGRSGAERAQTTSLGIRDVDGSMARLMSVRSEVGEVMNALDGTESRFAAQTLYSQTAKSNAEDMDMVKGISDFQNQQAGYSAALQAYSTVQRMTLFQYLNG